MIRVVKFTSERNWRGGQYVHYDVIVDGVVHGQVIETGGFHRWRACWDGAHDVESAEVHYKYSFIKAVRWVVWKGERSYKRRSEACKRAWEARRNRVDVERAAYPELCIDDFSWIQADGNAAVPRHVLAQIQWPEIEPVPMFGGLKISPGWAERAMQEDSEGR